MLTLSAKRHVMEVTELFRDCDWVRTDRDMGWVLVIECPAILES